MEGDSSKCNWKTQVALLFLVSPTSKKRAFKSTEKERQGIVGKKSNPMIIASNNDNDNYFFTNYCNIPGHYIKPFGPLCKNSYKGISPLHYGNM